MVDASKSLPLADFLHLLRDDNVPAMLATIFSLRREVPEQRRQLQLLKKHFWCECECVLAPIPCGCDQEAFRFVWSLTSEIVVDDLAEGRLTEEQILRRRGVTAGQLERWRRHPEFQTRLRERALEIEAETGIPRRDEPPPLLQLAPCGCPILWQGCGHMPKDPLPFRVAAALLYRLYPAEYGEPPLPAEPSEMRSQDDCAWLMMRRALAGNGLWHPDDYRQRPRRPG